MALPAPPTSELDRLAQYNGNAYDEISNPYGFAYGGHRQNFPQSLTDFAITGNWIVNAATYLEGQVALIDEAVTDAQQAAAAAHQSAEDAALFDPSSYYPKAYIDGALADKADRSAVYTKTEIDASLANMAGALEDTAFWLVMTS